MCYTVLMPTKKINTKRTNNKTTRAATANKSTTKKTARKVAKADPSEAVTKKTLLQRIKDMRAARLARKEEIKRHKQTDKARQEKAKQRAIREKALEQVNEAVMKSKRRRSRPGLTLFFALILAGLGGVAAYQYRQIEVDDKDVAIAELRSDIITFEEQKQAIEQAAQIEAERFQNVQLNEGATMRVPSGWTAKETSLPIQEQVIGDDNVTMKIISSDSRNSITQFIPTVDYVWTIESANVGSPVQLLSQSLHCERFDTLSNDLSEELREHKGFNVYCDTDSEKVEIAALSSPEKYGTQATNTFFLISIRDLQQVDLDDIVTYIESFTR